MKSLDEHRLPAALGISALTRCNKPSCSYTSSLATLSRVTMLALIILCTSLSVVQAGPVVTRPRRMMREIYAEITDSSAQNVTNFIADTCLYDGSQVSRTSIVCQKKHGCRAIQKTGECCPDYQCECQRDGKTYANGEKVFDPETPCRVCYCQGGEFSCSQVTCYKRHDCEPKFIPGRCCPEYDNCPPLESSKITEATSPKDETIEVKETEIDAEDLLELDQQSKVSSNTPTTTSVATESSTPAKITIPAASNNPLGLKIKEITKAEEIRLTDNHPMVMTTTTTTTTSSSKDDLLEASGSHSEEANNLEHLDMNITDDGDNGMKNVRHTDEDMLANGTAEVTDSSENATSGAPESSEMEVSSEASSSTTVRILTPSSTTAMPDDVSDEVTKKDKPLPAVVQIGDKLVIVDHNQPKPITVIQVEEVEGLQRGEDDISYDQEMYTDRAPENRETSKHMKLENADGDMLSTQADSSVAYETVFYTGSTENNTSEEVFETQLYTEGPESAEHNDTQSDQLSASSEEFIQLSSSSEKPARLEEEPHHTTVNPLSVSSEEGSTTESDYHLSSASSEASGDEVYETHYYTEGPGGSSETTEGAPVSSEAPASTKSTRDQLTVDDMTTHRKTYIEDDEHDLIQPGFQPIPEDFSLPLRDQPVMMELADEPDQRPPTKGERKDDAVGEKILSEVFELRQNSTSTTTESTNTDDNEATNSPAWLKEEEKSQVRLAPGEPLLVPYWERNNTTNVSSSSSSSEEEFSGAGSLNTGEYHVLKMNSDEYVDGFEGSGQNVTKKEVEETTLAPTKLQQQDIDALDSGSSSESDSVKHNPKNDVESVKYDENENNTAEEALPKQIKGNV